MRLCKRGLHQYDGQFCRECSRARNREWYAKNRTADSARRKAYRRANLERLIQNERDRAAANPRGVAWGKYRHSAKQRGLVFALDRRHFDDLVTDVCYWCGAPPAPVNGIDRMDNSRGYVEDNVVSCCYSCNTSKLQRTPEEFKAWILRAASWQQRCSTTN